MKTTNKEINIFVSYSHLDNKWFKQEKELFDLIPFLERSLVSKNVKLWYDRHNLNGIEAGEKFRGKIESQIDLSDLAILLISQDFLNSKFISEVEFPLIRDKYESGKLLIFPILLEPCDWEEIEFISMLQLVPGKPTPLIEFTENEKAWKQVRYELLRSLKNKIERIQNKTENSESAGSYLPGPKRSVPISRNKKVPIWSVIILSLAILFFLINPSHILRSKNSASQIATVTIGNQEWMGKNLNVSIFRNGDSIREVKSDEAWKQAGENKTPAWCYYRNDPSNDNKYGKLYNWYAINDVRGLAPAGFHVPNKSEMDTLLSQVGGEGEQAYLSLITNGKSGFNSLLGGCRADVGEFLPRTTFAYWTSSEGYQGSGSSWHLILDRDKKNAITMYYHNNMGFAVRCLSGEKTEELNPVNEFLYAGGSIDELTKSPSIKLVNIRGQEWMTENLKTSFFQNGDQIPEAKTNQEWQECGKNKTPAWCFYNNDPSNENKFGRLYNWYAVHDKRGISPKGFHVPTKEEIDVLLKNLGGEGKNAFSQLVPGSTSRILTVFSYSRKNGGSFILKNHSGFWSSTEGSYGNGYSWSLIIDENEMFAKPMYMYCNMGFSIRCLKDKGSEN